MPISPAKTALVTLCYLDGNDASGGSRVERNVKYIEYYRKLKEQLGFSHFILLDNASSWEARDSFRYRLKDNSDIIFVGFSDYLARKGGYDYPYCWRGLNYLRHYMDRFEKLMCIDSDYFVCSERLATYLRELETGWTSLWSAAYQFPEAACHVICKDQFYRWDLTDWNAWNGHVMETFLPFTHIERDFIADRFGELGAPPQNPKMDAYGQTPVSMEIKFYG